MKLYITFGQNHAHHVNNHTFDCNCVAEIEAADYQTGREKAFELFGPKFATSYSEKEVTPDFLKYFPRGIIQI